MNNDSVSDAMDSILRKLMERKPRVRFLFYNPNGYYRIIISLLRKGVAKDEKSLLVAMESEGISLVPMDEIPSEGSDKGGFAILIDPVYMVIEGGWVGWKMVNMEQIRRAIRIYLACNKRHIGLISLSIDWSQESVFRQVAITPFDHSAISRTGSCSNSGSNPPSP